MVQNCSLLFCSFFSFAASINHPTNVTIGSHNLHSYKKSSSFHKSCLQRYGGVWFGQELWLQESKLSVMSELGVQYVAHSGMEEAVSSGMLSGRPYGGVSISWAPDLNHVMRPLVNYKHKRLICVEMKAEPSSIIFISLYMPFYDSSNRAMCISETIDAISMLEEVIADHPLHMFVVGGDFNTEFVNDSPFDNLWRGCIAKTNLVCCDQYINNNNNNNNNNNFTYIHQSLNQSKWNDHFFLSPSLVKNSNNHFILDDGDNVSDHLPIMMNLSCHLSPCPPIDVSPQKQPSLIWEKCSEVQKSAYNGRLRQLLIDSPSRLQCCANVHCTNETCRAAIQEEYNNLINQISKADKILPRHKSGVQKSWWTDELTSIRNKSIEIHKLWISEGRPRSGPTNEERLRVKAAYKREIRQAQRAPKQSCWNRLHGAMVSKDTTNFWKSWRNLYNKNRPSLHPVVNGVSDKNVICNSFASHFSKVSKPNNVAQVKKLEEDFRQLYHQAEMTHECDCSNHSISLQTVLDAGFSLRKGKTCDDDKIHAEHFFNAPLTLFDRLQLLFNSMLSHAFVPSQFRLGTIIPLIKDRHGDAGELNNYRGITIAPIFSKIFEHVLRIQFDEYLSTSNYQFGFKRKSSTSHAIHSLKETINYYTHRGSNVYCAFLDASKAFDRLVHAGLFTKLLQRGIPLIFLNILMFWYKDLKC